MPEHQIKQIGTTSRQTLHQRHQTISISGTIDQSNKQQSRQIALARVWRQTELIKEFIDRLVLSPFVGFRQYCRHLFILLERHSIKQQRHKTRTSTLFRCAPSSIQSAAPLNDSWCETNCRTRRKYDTGGGRQCLRSVFLVRNG
jgi:hypothetical protein